MAFRTKKNEENETPQNPNPDGKRKNELPGFLKPASGAEVRSKEKLIRGSIPKMATDSDLETQLNILRGVGPDGNPYPYSMEEKINAAKALDELFLTTKLSSSQVDEACLVLANLFQTESFQGNLRSCVENAFSRLVDSSRKGSAKVSESAAKVTVGILITFLDKPENQADIALIAYTLFELSHIASMDSVVANKLCDWAENCASSGFGSWYSFFGVAAEFIPFMDEPTAIRSMRPGFELGNPAEKTSLIYHLAMGYFHSFSPGLKSYVVGQALDILAEGDIAGNSRLMDIVSRFFLASDYAANLPAEQKTRLVGLSDLLRPVALDPNLDADTKGNAGALFTQICFIEPTLFDKPENFAIFGFDSVTAGKMVEKSHDWPIHVPIPGEYVRNDRKAYFYHMDYDCLAIFNLCANGKQMVKTLFEGAGWTYFNMHSEGYFTYLFKALRGEVDLGGKDLLVEFATTRGAYPEFTDASNAAFKNYGGTSANNYSDAAIAVISIQPGNRDELQRIHDYIGAHVRDGGGHLFEKRHFSMAEFSMHGSATNMLMKTRGWAGALGDFDEFIDMDPLFLAELGLNWFEKTPDNEYGKTVIVNNACSTGDVASVPVNLARAMANTMDAIVVASTDLATTLVSVPFKRGKNNAMVIDISDVSESTFPGLRKPKAFYPEATHVSSQDVADSFGVSQNYPNPFNAKTTIRYSMPRDGRVTIKVYDILGREVAAVLDGFEAAGNHEVEFSAGKLTSGTYFYRIEANGISETRKMLLLK